MRFLRSASEQFSLNDYYCLCKRLLILVLVKWHFFGDSKGHHVAHNYYIFFAYIFICDHKWAKTLVLFVTFHRNLVANRSSNTQEINKMAKPFEIQIIPKTFNILLNCEMGAFKNSIFITNSSTVFLIYLSFSLSFTDANRL